MKYQAMLLGLSAAVLAASCSPVINNRGNEPNPVLLAQIEPGVQSKEDVMRMLGSPSSQAMFEEETWFYISGKQEQVAFFAPEELEREVVAISFDAEGKVKEVRKITKEDGLDISMSSKETTTSGHTFGVLEQMFGNVGRFESK